MACMMDDDPLWRKERMAELAAEGTDWVQFLRVVAVAQPFEGDFGICLQLAADEFERVRAALGATRKLVSEAAMTGFNCHDGDWAERLFANQAAITAALAPALEQKGGRLMGLHLGKTLYPACLRFHRGTIRMKGRPDQECFFEHPIRWWFGMSWGTKWFVGFVRVDGTRDVRALGQPAGDKEG